MCVAGKDDMQGGEKNAQRRTSAFLTDQAKKLERLEAGRKNKSQKFNQECFSARTTSMHNLLNYRILVPPLLHCLTGAVNKMIDFIKKDPLLYDEFSSFARKNELYIQYPSHELNGQQARRLLSAMRDQYYRGPLWEQFSALSEVESLCVADWLSESQIELFQTNINKFFSLLRKLPDFPITPKLHILEIHAPEFVKETKSWGRFSEQCKSFHYRLI